MPIWVYLVTFGAGLLTGTGVTFLLVGVFAALVCGKQEDERMAYFFGPRDG